MRRGLTNWIVYPAFLIAVLVGTAKLLHWRYLQQITPVSTSPETPAEPPIAPVANIDPETSARIGALAPPRPGSFLLASRDKPPGTVRIGTFGDSFTYGVEVDEGFDWPSQLEALLRERSDVPVEVLNFGSPGFGFHQMHMMAEFVAPPFGLDYAVFAPLPTYWAGRDLTFSFWPPGAGPRLGFHSRYVLAGDGLDLVDVVGNTEPERFAAYTRFVPPLRYLRFDERAPAFLQAWLPEGRTLRNPFYYSGLSRAEETTETYRRLLQRAISMRPHAIVIETLNDLGDVVDSDPRLMERLLRRPIPKRFPYSAPHGHWSPWGQRLVAEEVVRAFGVGTEEPVAIVETEPDRDPLARGSTREPLDTYRNMYIDLQGLVVGNLYEHQPGGYAARRVTRLPEDTRYLIALTTPEQPLVDGVFIPLANAPPPALTVDLGDGRAATVPLLWVDPAVARADLCTPALLGQSAEAGPHGGCLLPLDWASERPRHPRQVRAGEHILADIGETLAYPPGTLWMRRSYFRAYAASNLSGDPINLAPQGAISLVMRRGGLRPRWVPLGRYRRVWEPPSITKPLVTLGAALAPRDGPR